MGAEKSLILRLGRNSVLALCFQMWFYFTLREAWWVGFKVSSIKGKCWSSKSWTIKGLFSNCSDQARCPSIWLIHPLLGTFSVFLRESQVHRRAEQECEGKGTSMLCPVMPSLLPLLCVWIYVYDYFCVYVYMFICIYVLCVYPCIIFVGICKIIYVHLCNICACVYVCIYVCAYLYVHMHLCVHYVSCMCICICLYNICLYTCLYM